MSDEESSDGIWIVDSFDEGDGRLESLGSRGRTKISSERLGEFIQDFTGTLTSVLQRVEQGAGDYALSQVTVHATLSGEYGFSLLAKAGAEAGVTFTFVKQP